MAKKKRHINNSRDLEQAIRAIGGVISYTLDELNSSRKMVDEEVLNKQLEKYSFDDIWNAKSPITNKSISKTLVIDFQQKVNDSWGMAARGSADLSSNVIDKMIKNEGRHDR